MEGLVKERLERYLQHLEAESFDCCPRDDFIDFAPLKGSAGSELEAEEHMQNNIGRIRQLIADRGLVEKPSAAEVECNAERRIGAVQQRVMMDMLVERRKLRWQVRDEQSRIARVRAWPQEGMFRGGIVGRAL